MIYDIIVIGGGPAGMTAAIKAKETAPSASVKLIDKNKKLGKKLYATGNGKCNIANTKLDLSCYSSANEFFPFQFVTTDSHNDVMDFFESLGVSSYDDNGYIYPVSLQASTIVWALTDRLKILGIENSTSEEVLSIKQGKDGTYLVCRNGVTNEQAGKITPNPLRLRFWVTYQAGESEAMLDVLTFQGNKDYQVFFRIGKDQSDCIFTTNESEALAGEVRSLLESRANDK